MQPAIPVQASKRASSFAISNAPAPLFFFANGVIVRGYIAGFAGVYCLMGFSVSLVSPKGEKLSLRLLCGEGWSDL